MLDDADTVVGSPSERLLARILRFGPPQLHLVVLARVRLELGQSRAHLMGRLDELDGQDLAFTRTELRDLLHLRGRTVPDAVVAELHERTEGWAAGVGIFAAALGHRTVPAGAHEGVLEGVSLATEFLLDEVYAVQPPDVQAVLLAAATVDPVCGELVDALTGGDGGARALGVLHDHHLFLHRLGPGEDDRVWYRWHPLLRAALLRRLAQTEPALVTRSHLAAARWHERHGSMVEGVRHAVAGGDTSLGARLLGECWLDLAFAGESRLLTELLHLFAEDLRAAEPELAVVCSFLRLRTRALDTASRCATEAAQSAHRLPDGPRRRRVQAGAAVVLLHAATLAGHPASAGLRESALGQIATIEGRDGFLSRRDRELLALLLTHLGALEAIHLQPDARARIEDGLSYATTLDRPGLELRSQAQLSLAELAAGRLRAARTRATEVVAAGREGSWWSPHAAASAYNALGGVELLQGYLVAALQHLSHADRVGDPADRVNQFRTGLLTQLTLLALGRVPAARERLQPLEDLVRGWEPPAWGQAMLHVVRADQLLAEGHPDDALEQLRSEQLPPDAAEGAIRATWQAEVLRRAGRPAEAGPLLRAVLGAEERSPALLFARVSLALVEDALGRPDESLEQLDQALAVSGQESVVYPYLRLGRDVEPLLTRLLDRGTAHGDLVVTVLDRLGPAGVPGPPVQHFEPLTAREREVLRAVQGWESNEQVAARLFISPNTLRTHVKHLHRKLGTSTRREAVTRAREMGII